VPIPTKEYSKPGVCLAIYNKKVSYGKRRIIIQIFHHAKT
jgi:hypothetical protein